MLLEGHTVRVRDKHQCICASNTFKRKVQMQVRLETCFQNVPVLKLFSMFELVLLLVKQWL